MKKNFNVPVALNVTQCLEQSEQNRPMTTAFKLDFTSLSENHQLKCCGHWPNRSDLHVAYISDVNLNNN